MMLSNVRVPHLLPFPPVYRALTTPSLTRSNLLESLVDHARQAITSPPRSAGPCQDWSQDHSRLHLRCRPPKDHILSHLQANGQPVDLRRPRLTVCRRSTGARAPALSPYRLPAALPLSLFSSTQVLNHHRQSRLCPQSPTWVHRIPWHLVHQDMPRVTMCDIIATHNISHYHININMSTLT